VKLIKEYCEASEQQVFKSLVCSSVLMFPRFYRKSLVVSLEFQLLIILELTLVCLPCGGEKNEMGLLMLRTGYWEKYRDGSMLSYRRLAETFWLRRWFRLYRPIRWTCSSFLPQFAKKWIPWLLISGRGMVRGRNIYNGYPRKLSDSRRLEGG